MGKKSKSLKGFITGESRRKKRAEKKRIASLKTISESNSSVTEPVSPSKHDDDQTLYGAVLDSVPEDTAPKKEEITKVAAIEPVIEEEKKETEEVPKEETSPVTETSNIQLILLVMDPDSRRFELLRLDFNPEKALVKDILSQIERAAEEETLRTLLYTQVCDRSGKVMDNETKLSKYFEGSGIVIAVKDDIEPEYCARLAKPILNDPKIVEMLGVNNIDAAPSTDKNDDVEPIEDVDTSEVPMMQVSDVSNVETPPEPEPKVIGGAVKAKSMPKPVQQSIEIKPEPSKEPKPSSMSFITYAVLGIIIGLVFRIHQRIASPMKLGDTLSPGQIRSQCGIFPATFCKSATLEMGFDGVLQVLQDEEVKFSMQGSDCSDKETCVPGAVLESDGLFIGGEKAIFAKKSEISLTPWPFVEGTHLKHGKLSWV